MRLIKCEQDGTLRLMEYYDPDIPCYAILSHTWGEDGEEVTFKDITDGTGGDKSGYKKILFCRAQATRDKLQFFWVDTCCIDKSNSNELHEAINSMFRWYKKAAKCYVYLSDVSARQEEFTKSRWFDRGWTLQELVAPASVEFFSKEGSRLGNKRSREAQIHERTKIAVGALRGEPLTNFDVMERFSWASHRETKRPEDRCYSLLGLFDIHMPLIYGEGMDKALLRLRKAIDEDAKDRERPYADFMPFTQFSKATISINSGLPVSTVSGQAIYTRSNKAVSSPVREHPTVTATSTVLLPRTGRRTTAGLVPDTHKSASVVRHSRHDDEIQKVPTRPTVNSSSGGRGAYDMSLVGHGPIPRESRKVVNTSSIDRHGQTSVLSRPTRPYIPQDSEDDEQPIGKPYKQSIGKPYEQSIGKPLSTARHGQAPMLSRHSQAPMLSRPTRPYIQQDSEDDEQPIGKPLSTARHSQVPMLSRPTRPYIQQDSEDDEQPIGKPLSTARHSQVPMLFRPTRPYIQQDSEDDEQHIGKPFSTARHSQAPMLSRPTRPIYGKIPKMMSNT